MQVVSVGIHDIFPKTIAMATSLDKLENKVQIYQVLSYGKKIVKIGPVDTEIALLIVKKKKKRRN